MELERLTAYFETSPSVKLFRSTQNAPFVVHFLFQQFKKAGRITVPHSELLAALLEYRESLAETHAGALRDKAELYLSAWCAGETRWLRRFVDTGGSEPAYQLTPHVEEVLVFLDQALNKELGFVGTESRLRLVIDMLADLVAGATTDVEVKLRHLREARAKLDDEITRVLTGGAVATYEPAQVRERFATAVSLLKQLLGDFRAVEDRFKEITRQVQQRQVDGRDSRGAILAFALDSEDVLKAEDQGVSFYEFVNFILSPVQQDRLKAVIGELAHLKDLAAQGEGLSSVRRMVPSLLAEAEKVMRTNQRLSATLRRLLDSRSVTERQRLAQLLGEIKALAAQCADDPPWHVSVSVDRAVEIRSPLARTFWTRPADFVAVDLVERGGDETLRATLFARLAEMARLDWADMRRRVAGATATHGSVTLAELFRDAPPAQGAVELLGFLQIARDDGHLINAAQDEDVVVRLPSDGRPGLKLRVPFVLFLPPVEGIDVERHPERHA